MTREERLQAFVKCTIAHPHIVIAGRALQEVLREPGCASLVFVYGPSGVGKTALMNYIRRTLETEMVSILGEDEKRPLLNMLARPPLSGSFGWQDFLQSGILAVREQTLDHRRAFRVSDEKTHLDWPEGSRTKRRPAEGMKENALRISLEADLRRRRPLAIIVDDAHHLSRVSRDRQLLHQLDCIKSLADVTETIYVRYHQPPL